MNPYDPALNQVEELVLGYLHRHPDAADTLEGIVGWWLPLQRYETERDRVRTALDALVASGSLRRERLPDGSALYALQTGAGDEANVLN